MTLSELRAKRAKALERMNTLLEAAENDGRDLTEDEAREYDEREAESRGIERTIERRASLDEARTRLDERQERGAMTGPEAGTGTDTDEGERREANVVRVGGDRAATRNWRSLGEFVSALRFRPADPRLVEQRELSAGTDEAGGFAIPDQFRRDLLETTPEEAVFRPRANVIPAGDPPDAKITIPALDQTSTGSNMYGGVEVQWIEEGAEKPETDARIREITLQPHEVAGTLVVTDKLLRNWQAADPLIRRLLRGAITEAEEEAFLRGDGTGKPLGVLSSGAVVSVNRGTADQVSFADITAMYARAHRRGGMVWLYSPSVLDQLIPMQATGGGQLIWQASAREASPDRLFGLPALSVERAPALGERGDLMLVDLNHYLIKDGSGPFVQASEHVLFRQNKTVVKAFSNVDGKPWMEAPYTIAGTTYSPFVALDVPSA